ncbi:MAG TPA: hypothetical protein VFM21_00255, partial [Terriglobia bacterium]|nr:hypothetical protein [Terriglobia bacterium]
MIQLTQVIPVTQLTHFFSDRPSVPDSPPVAPAQPWRFPSQGLAVFHGAGSAARLSHYFLPRLFREDKRVLMLDGANSADPRLIARFARERGVAFSEFSRRIQIARAFTCFQLTELVRRVPRFVRDFPAEVLIVTALPDLYFDEDVRDWDARVAFEQALEGLRRCASLPLSVAIFSSAADFAPLPARRRFFDQVCASAAEVWKFDLSEGHHPQLLCERSLS